MKYLKQFESKEYIEDFLNKDSINYNFVELIDLGYSYGYNNMRPGFHRGGYKVYDGKNPENNVLDQFTLCFYKLLGTWDKYIYRSMIEYQNELDAINHGASQYTPSLPNFEFSGMFMKSDGIPLAKKLQCIELKFTNKDYPFTPPKGIIGNDIEAF